MIRSEIPICGAAIPTNSKLFITLNILERRKLISFDVMSSFGTASATFRKTGSPIWTRGKE